MKGRKVISFFLAVILMLSCMPFSSFAATQADTYLQNIMKSNSVSKAQVVIIREGRVAYSYSYGCNQYNKFNVYAISKSVLGILAAKMQDDGVLDLDTNIATYWHELHSKDVDSCSADWLSYYGSADTVASYTASSISLVENSPSLRNCLTHSSTIKESSMNYLVVPKDGSTPYGEYFRGSMGHNYGVAAFMLWHTDSQLFESGGVPGKKTSYNPNKESLTRGHALAGFTMQIATDVSLNEYLQSEILDKVDASSDPEFAKVSWSKKLKNGITLDAEDDLRTVGNSFEFATSYETSALDLAKLITVILNDGMYGNTRIMSQDAVDEILKVESNLKNQTIAFNYVNGKYEKSGRYTDTTGFAKYKISQGNNYSYVSFDPDEKSGLIVTVTGKYSSFNYKNFIKAVQNYESKTFEYVHEHSFEPATCTEPSKCFCGETKGTALGHDFGANGKCTRCEAGCTHLKINKELKCAVCGKYLNIQGLDVNSFSTVFKNYTEIRDRTCVVANGSTIQVLDKDATVLVDDETKAVVNGSTIKIIAPGRFNVILLKNNQYMRASFFGWNAQISGKVGAYYYSDEARTQKVGVLYANAFLALESTSQPSTLKVKEVFWSGGNATSDALIGSFITNYNNSSNTNAAQYYTYSF